MVRKYSVIDKHKFAKKCSTSENYSNKETLLNNKNNDQTDNVEVCNNRYYISHDSENNTSESVDNNPDENISDAAFCIRSRPKLGSLPSFIAFEET